MARQFVIGDIHGYYRKMMGLFKTVSFDYDHDILVSLGDLVDRGPQPLEVIEELRKIRHFIHVSGNHDEWCYQYLKYERKTDEWTNQGGRITVEAYDQRQDLKEIHIDFFENARLYYVDPESRLFLHAGYNSKLPFELQKQDKRTLLWDRTLVGDAYLKHCLGVKFPEFNEIFIGHTPTQFLGETTPINMSNLWMMDTGVTVGGQLSIMDVATKQYWQSESLDDYEIPDTSHVFT